MTKMRRMSTFSYKDLKFSWSDRDTWLQDLQVKSFYARRASMLQCKGWMTACRLLTLGCIAGDSARSYSQMDAATLFLNQQHMQQQIQNFGQPANFNANITPNFNVVRNYLMANPTAQRPELFFPRVMNQREADARMELPNVCQAEAWKLA